MRPGSTDELLCNLRSERDTYYRSVTRLLRLIEESGQLCPWCGVFLSSAHHRQDCPVTEARRLVVERDNSEHPSSAPKCADCGGRGWIALADDHVESCPKCPA